MAMDIQDMVAAMAAKNEAFRGNEKVPEKVEVYNKLKEHAAAISKAMRTPWHADNLGLREQNTFIYVDFPLPVSILNDSIRNRISEMYKLAAMVTLADVNCRLRLEGMSVWTENSARTLSRTATHSSLCTMTKIMKNSRSRPKV